jgi:hypothetical protein
MSGTTLGDTWATADAQCSVDVCLLFAVDGATKWPQDVGLQSSCLGVIIAFMDGVHGGTHHRTAAIRLWLRAHAVAHQHQASGNDGLPFRA